LPAGFTAELNELDDQGLLPFRPDELGVGGSGRAGLAPTAEAWDAMVAAEVLEVAAGDRLTNDEPAPSPTDEVQPASWIAATEADAVVTDGWAAPETSDWMTDSDSRSAMWVNEPVAERATWVDEPVAEVIAAEPMVMPPPMVEMRERRDAWPSASHASQEALATLPPAMPNYGGTITLPGSLFEQLRARKEELVTSGALLIRRSEAPAAVAPMVDFGVERAEAISDAEPTDPVAPARRCPRSQRSTGRRGAPVPPVASDGPGDGERPGRADRGSGRRVSLGAAGHAPPGRVIYASGSIWSGPSHLSVVAVGWRGGLNG
jgi:hypothetical protein